MIAPSIRPWERRTIRLRRLPIGLHLTLTEAAAIMGISRKNLQANYLLSATWQLPSWVEAVRDAGRIVGIKRIG